MGNLSRFSTLPSLILPALIMVGRHQTEVELDCMVASEGKVNIEWDIQDVNINGRIRLLAL